MISIPISAYKHLVNDSVNLQKRNVTIEKLKNTLRQKVMENNELRRRKMRKSSDVCNIKQCIESRNIN